MAYRGYHAEMIDENAMILADKIKEVIENGND